MKGVLTLMADLCQRGMTMVVVTRDGLRPARGRPVVFMDEGEIVEAGTPEQIFDRPQSARLQRFLSEVL